MDSITLYFSCDACENRDFKPLYRFAMKFHSVNFSDDLIYDREMDELFQCTKCLKTFTRKDIEKKLAEFKRYKKGKALRDLISSV